MKSFDLVVLGAGPGGYVAAIRAAQLGLNVACVDENQQLGGTCLRVGCIPSKALLQSSHLYHEAKENLEDHGIGIKKLELDLNRMLSRKDEIVKTLTGGIKMLFQRSKVTPVIGRGKISGPGRVTVQLKSGEIEELSAPKILIATGSVPLILPGIDFDGDLIGDSTTALSYEDVPESLIVIGGGYIGLELGSVWSRLGATVTVLEGADRVLPGLDNEIGKIARRIFEKQELTFETEAWVESATVENGQCVVKCKDREPLTAARVLVCTGRVANTKEIGLETIEISADKRGQIVVDENFETAAKGVYAIGDCIGGAMLAHKASDEGVACVEKFVNGFGSIHYDTIPAIVYTTPEIASVGKTEEQLKDAGVEYRKGICPFGANGRARAMGDFDGRIKILAHAETDRILGVHAIGPQAGDLIAEAAVAMQFGASSEDLARCCHAHPTLSEVMHEAALAVSGRAIHT
ncbi:MAG: dihydrolipoyl dehydrogenase [Pirellulaceae bacterium]|nr:dihydrolipoyl dehydrogenase [Pirellulaceae bacterium]MDG2467762.1 dihydrolipoyl dehydrogenase [Pirellulaceae bacterium]